MKITVLGRRGPYPAACEACSGYLAECGKTLVQLDLGCGTLPRLTRLAAPEELSALVLTHWHFDHCSDVLPLIYRLESYAAAHPGKTLDVYAPVDESSPVRQAVMNCAAMRLHDIAPGQQWRVGEITLEAFPARHPVPAVMLRLEGGGQTLCYTGDTNWQDNLVDYAKNADLLLADGLFTEKLWDERKPHLSAALCARLAKEAGVKRLMITHLNPALDEETLLQEARRIDPDAEIAVQEKTYVL